MSRRRSRSDQSYDAAQAHARRVLKDLLKQAGTRFGEELKGFWFYDGELCPGCSQPADFGAMEYKGQNATSLNAFAYRERGILIGYFLCRFCAAYIFEQNDRRPGADTPLHKTIEKNLIAAYHKHLQSLDA